MRGLASFKRPDQSAGCGFVQDGLVLDCSANHKSLLDVIRAGSLADLGPTAGMSSFALSEVVLQAPVVGSEKIICVGVNYANRNEEYKDGGEALRYPSLFVRFPDSFVGHEQPILRPRESEQLDYEGERWRMTGRFAIGSVTRSLTSLKAKTSTPRGAWGLGSCRLRKSI
jgi:hypothetical protein